MKKIFTILCAGILTLGLSAQTESGNMLVGVNSNLSYTSETSTVTTVTTTTDATTGLPVVSVSEEDVTEGTMNLQLEYGYFFMDNLAGMVNFGYAKAGEDDATTSYSIGARYYMGSIYAGTMYGSAGEKLSHINIHAGYLHMLTDNISLQPSLGYTMNSYDGESAGSGIALNVGFGLYF